MHHLELEQSLSDYTLREAARLTGAGYLAPLSLADHLREKASAILLDQYAHPALQDTARLAQCPIHVYEHRSPTSALELLSRTKGSSNVFLLSDGVFGLDGSIMPVERFHQLLPPEITFLIDDAHGFGTLGKTGAGTGEEQGVQDQIDVYFATFAKSMASTGAFISGDNEIIGFLRYNMRSQMFAKSLQIQLVIGALKRLELLQTKPELKDKLWENVNMLQTGLKQRGFDIGSTQSCVTPVYLEGSVPEAMALVRDLRENYQIFCSIVVYPVIPKGLILLRLIPTSSHNEYDINETLDAFASIREKLEKGVYKIASNGVGEEVN